MLPILNVELRIGWQRCNNPRGQLLKRPVSISIQHVGQAWQSSTCFGCSDRLVGRGEYWKLVARCEMLLIGKQSTPHLSPSLNSFPPVHLNPGHRSAKSRCRTPECAEAPGVLCFEQAFSLDQLAILKLKRSRMPAHLATGSPSNRQTTASPSGFRTTQKFPMISFVGFTRPHLHF